jgi:hypothetical protein
MMLAQEIGQVSRIDPQHRRRLALDSMSTRERFKKDFSF